EKNFPPPNKRRSAACVRLSKRRQLRVPASEGARLRTRWASENPLNRGLAEAISEVVVAERRNRTGAEGAKKKRKKRIAGVFLLWFAEEKNDRSKCGSVHTENSGDRRLRRAAASAGGGFSAEVAGDLRGEEEAQRIGGEKQPELKAFPVKKRQTA
ncbi:hypothetical protein U1Q18_040286, partial [Sarracenia purpurea var. burkii]